MRKLVRTPHLPRSLDEAHSEPLRAAKASAKAAFEMGRAPLQRHVFDAAIWRSEDVDDALRRMSGGCCAFCESPLQQERCADHFRPKGEARGGEKAMPLGYWWLAYEWTNLHPVCSVCSANKGSLFPVLHQRMVRGADDATEARLLIDPCRDNPLAYLSFDREGRAQGRVGPKPHPSGSSTIEIYGLNRAELVHRRRQVIVAFEEELARLRKGTVRELGAGLKRATRDGVEHVGAVRAYLRDLFGKKGEQQLQDALESTRLSWLSGEDKESTEEVEAQPFVAPIGRLQWIKIENFRGIEQLELSFDPQSSTPEDQSVSKATRSTETSSPREPWCVLLGENASGKSSVLQAIAVALGAFGGGNAALPSRLKQRLEPDLLRRGAAKGRIELKHMRDERSVVVNLGSEGASFDESSIAIPTFGSLVIRAYGANRISRTTRPTKSNANASGIHVKGRDLRSLFDPWYPLPDPATWLARLNDEAQAGAVQLLEQLLPRSGSGAAPRVKPAAGTVEVDLGSGFIPFDLLSDGYRAIIAIAVDLLRGPEDRYFQADAVQGIVLLDELGTHLHPRWKMQIVSSLRSAFPRLQFLATTHDPLCLRGLQKGEVVSLELREGKVSARTDLPSPADFRVDQLLTSRYFGLYSTLDPDLEAAFERYYELLSRKKSLDRGEHEELEKLREQVDRSYILGATVRDQLILEIIDRDIAKQRRAREGAGNWKLDQRTKDRVLRLWGHPRDREGDMS